MKENGIKLACCMAILIEIGCPEYAFAQRDMMFYSIQIGAYPTEHAASAQRDSMDDSQVFIHSDKDKSALPYKLCVGRYPTYTDAWAVKSAAAEPISKGFIIELADNITTRNSINHKAVETESVRKVFPFKVSFTDSLSSISVDQKSLVSLAVPEEKAVSVSELTSRSVQSMDRSELLAVGLASRNNTTGTQALTEFLQKFPDDQAKQAVRLRLARRLFAQKDFAGAKDYLSQVELGGNPEEKGKARLVRAYINASEDGNTVAHEAFKNLADDNGLPIELRSHAMRMAASHAHAAREYTTAVLAYKQIIEESPVIEDRMEAHLQRCAAMFELAGRGKGKWKETVRECSNVKVLADAPQYVKMGTSLMEFEACRFSGDFDRSYQLGKVFLQEWGEDPENYETRQMRQYINTARLFQMQNAYVVGQKNEALNIATNVVANPPGEKEQYESGNTFLYACVVGYLTANDQQATQFERKGRAFNDAYFTMLRDTMNELKAKYASNKKEGSVEK